jgi:tRNA nucleotidyltransferase (CCA-adding enzyme)
MQIYLVGGAVRDQLLGQPVTERDWVVVGSTPQAMLALGFKQVGKDFPVFLHPQTREEYALARKERKIGAGYYGFECQFDASVTLEEDLLRRDLTINAIAQNEQGQLIDPFGGERDIKARRLRHVSEAFVEDPVRVLRLARFKARFHYLGFEVADETRTLIYRMVKQGELNSLVPERVWQEWEKSLQTAHPEVFIKTLREAGALSVILPELDALFGVPAKPQSHPEIDSGVHTLQVVASLRQLAAAPESIFAALTHDLGKAATPREMWPSHAGHDERGEPLLMALCERLRIPSVYRDLARQAVRFHLKLHLGRALPNETILDVLIGVGAFRQSPQLQALLQISAADRKEVLPIHPQEAFWLACMQACLAVEIKNWVEQGWSGKQIQAGLKQARLETIEKIKRNFMYTLRN